MDGEPAEMRLYVETPLNRQLSERQARISVRLVMLVLATIAMIGVSVSTAIRCRLNWTRYPRRTKRHLLLVSAVSVVTYTAMLGAHWRFSSPVVNEILGSLAVGAYSLLVVLMTLLRPKLLFYGLVTLLFLVVPVALVVLPLSAFCQASIETEHIAGDLYFDKVPWDAGAMGSSGTTLLIYERPAFVPFMVHDLQRVIFDDEKCISNKALVLLQPDGRHVLARCPWPDYKHKQGFHDFLVPLL